MTSHVDSASTGVTGYAFSNSAPEATDQLSSLETVLDPVTTGYLAELDLQPGARCLELGAGGGSIARWLANRVGPSARVFAVDADTSRLTAIDGIEVHSHDLNTITLPVEGPFDLIHARLVLLHLPKRHEVLRMLVDALAPGGWLVLGEFSDRPLRVLTSSSRGHAEVFDRVIKALLEELARHGADMTWAYDVHSAMAEAGLDDVGTMEHGSSWSGGGAGAHLHEVNSIQKAEALIAAGITREELAEFREITSDPGFSAMSYQLIISRGRRRHAASLDR